MLVEIVAKHEKTSLCIRSINTPHTMNYRYSSVNFNQIILTRNLAHEYGSEWLQNLIAIQLWYVFYVNIQSFLCPRPLVASSSTLKISIIKIPYNYVKILPIRIRAVIRNLQLPKPSLISLHCLVSSNISIFISIIRVKHISSLFDFTFAQQLW
jgi:hypothetical protein